MVLQAKTASAINTTEPVVHVWFFDTPPQVKPTFEDYLRAMTRTVMTNTTDVTICAAPRAGTIRNVFAIAIYNRSLDTEIFTVSTYDSTNRYPLETKTCATLETLHYEDGEGFYVS
jgi:hypothetical protein